MYKYFIITVSFSFLLADNEVGAVCCSGDGDQIMKFCPSFMVMEFMRQVLCKYLNTFLFKKKPFYVLCFHSAVTTSWFGQAVR